MMRKVAVIGAGSWGTALAILLARKNIEVVLWGRNAAHMAVMQQSRENTRYLPGHTFPNLLAATGTLEQALVGADCVVMVVPSHGFRQVYRQLVPFLVAGIPVVSAVKGIETSTTRTMTQVMQEESNGKKMSFCVLSGPSFAEEVALGHPTAITVACADIEKATEVQQLFSSSLFRVYSSNDVIGLEISGAMKNVIAIAAGISDGLGYGLNTRAALITRGLAEITRLGTALGADARTFAGLGGLGDLVLTCTGNLSRNRTVGLKLGAGKNLEQVLAEMTMVAEGVKTTMSCYHLAQQAGVEMPILEQTHAVLYQNKRCEDAVFDLFQRDLKEELIVSI
ncbi:MAG: NAD(P)-dependent glycerol-3-phosphate dehydrogenase [Desulfobulbaceae bacterium]|nr:NAD(P)-dependent glycerol-3-phosphate dehydrogenase [Desulfobulbaceae bacterium]